MLRRTFFCLLWLGLAAFGPAGSAWPQQLADPENLPENSTGQGDSGPRTPLGTVQGFMRAAELGDYQLASTFLDLRYLPEEVADIDGQRLAEQLYIVISRELHIDFGALSTSPEGVADDGLPSYRDELGKLATARGSQTIFLQRVPTPDGGRVWKVSNASVALIPDLYEEFGYSPVVENFREKLPKGSFLGAELFKWIIAVSAGAMAIIFWLVLSWPLGRVLTHHHAENTARVRRYLSRPVPVAIFVLVVWYVMIDLGLGLTASRIASSATLLTLVTVWLLFALLNLLRDLYGRHLESRGRDSGLMLLGPITSTFKVLVAVLAMVFWLDNLGVNVTTLFASLGLGGVAIVLVLQKPMEDILGAITLYTQQPVKVGQFCTSGSITGTIEEISLRSTRVRKIDNSVVIIPNSIFATASIQNVSAREHILHRQTVRLSLGTEASRIRLVLEKLREMLASNENVVADIWRVRLVEFGQFSLNIEVFAHIATTDWVAFLAIAEELNLGTIQVLEETGVRLAIPARSDVV